MSGKRDSDPRPLVWETNALPTELFPLLYRCYYWLQVNIHLIQAKEKPPDVNQMAE